jgi:hypothetical protein
VSRFWICSLKAPRNTSFAAAQPLLFLTTGNAWAQDFPDQSDQIAAPDMWSGFGERILILLAAGAVGFAVGAFFSPLLKPCRRIVCGVFWRWPWPLLCSAHRRAQMAAFSLSFTAKRFAGRKIAASGLG